MNKLFYKILLIISTFILGLSFVSMWKSNSSTPKTILSAESNFTQFQEDRASENIETLPMLKMNELKINGIELDSTFSTVIRQIGKPLRVKKGGFDNCADGFRKTLQYSGLIIELISDENRKNFKVVSIDVTSSKWSVSGISNGANKKDVQARFRNNYVESKESELDVLSYLSNEGWIVFYFHNDKLVEISWEYNFC